MAKEKWSKGKEAGTVVSDTSHYKHEMPDKIEYYGGYLIAKSIPSRFINVIVEAMNMLTLLEKALPIIEEEAERRDAAPNKERIEGYYSEMRDLADEISAEIDKAKGNGVSDG